MKTATIILLVLALLAAAAIRRRGIRGLVAKIEQWGKNHALLIAAADPRIIPDPVLADLLSLRDNMVSLQVIAFAESRESSEA